MRLLLSRLWPVPVYRWPVTVTMLVTTSLVGCAARHTSGSMTVAVAAHATAVMAVMAVLAVRSTVRARRFRREHRDVFD